MRRKLEYIHPTQLDGFREVKSAEEYANDATHFTFIPGEDGWDEVVYLVRKNGQENNKTKRSRSSKDNNQA